MTEQTSQKTSQPIHLCLIVVAVSLAYSSVFGAAFLSWDDGEYILRNNDIRAINATNINAWFSNFYLGNYHPLTLFSYALDYLIGGINPFIYHLTSILLHVVNACLVYLLFCKLRLQNWIALVIALIFALHPSQTESVSWVAERKTVLSGFFFLLAILQHIKYTQNPTSKKLILVVIAGACAMLSKATAVVLPVSLLAVDVWLGRDMRTMKVWKEKLPLFVMGFLIGLVAITAQVSGNFVATDAERTALEPVLYAGYAYVQYIVHFFVPVKLAAMYPYPAQAGVIQYLFLLISIGIVALFYISIRKGWNILTGGILFFTANIILLLQIIPFGEALMADRYVYIASIGIIYPFVYYLQWAWLQIGIKKLPLKIAAAVTIVALIAGTYVRNDAWLNNMNFFNALLKTYPESPVAQYSVGAMHLHSGNYILAEIHLNKAVALAPTNYKAWYNKGLLHARQGKAMEALDAFNRSISINNYTKAYYSRALLHHSTGNIGAALTDINTVLLAEPNNAKALFLKGYCQERMNDLQGALKSYNSALEYNKTEPLFYARRGILYCKMKQFESAITDLNFAVTNGGGTGEAYYWRGIAKHESGGNACADLDMALKMKYARAKEAMAKLCN